MYYKIPTQIPLCSPTEGDTEYIKYGLGEGEDFEGIKYTDFNVPEEAVAHFWNLIPENRRSEFEISLMTINRDILPHTDSDSKTAINWYLKTGAYVTSFCQAKEGSESFQLFTQTDGVIYMFEDVEMEKSFTAEDNDLYVLDVTKLHCVHSGEGHRIAMNLSTNIPYDEVLELLNVS